MKYLLKEHNKKFIGWGLIDSKLEKKLNYEQYLFISSMIDIAFKYGLSDLLNNDYKREIDLIDNTAERTNMPVVELLEREYEIKE
tara:strand:+ start:290 stop:544 length:255 start_codon:yes stop_codon:yes gene_type:complete